jgi:hypothetical protein
MNLEFPSGDPGLARLEVAAEVLNRFHWNISVEHVGNEVRLRGGELLIARFSSLEELEIFTAGMAFALSLLPAQVVAAIDQVAGDE